MLELVRILLAIALGMDIGVTLMIWAHDNNRGRYRNGCRSHPKEPPG